MRNSEEGKIGWIFTLGVGNPDPDLTGVFSPAWVYLRRYCSLTTIPGMPSLLTREIAHDQRKTTDNSGKRKLEPPLRRL